MGDLGFYEFFAGGGMARQGLGPQWSCLFANDFDPMKAKAYADNFGGGHMACCDVAGLSAKSLPGRPRLVWASFPCQDVSLAGEGRGLGGGDANRLSRSGAFWPFMRLVRGLAADGRAPDLVVLENVIGLLSSRGGADFEALLTAVDDADYDAGALVVDARHFLPQSRPRLFVVAYRKGLEPPQSLLRAGPDPLFHPPALTSAERRLSPDLHRRWRWWALPAPTFPPLALEDVVEDAIPFREGAAAAEAMEAERLIAIMTPANRAKVDAALAAGGRRVGALYKRTRTLADGARVVRAEVRFDAKAGCLRTPAGGSSRQTLLIAENGGLRARLITAREAARLMGLPDSYRLPERYTEAYHLLGDGVAVPVVRHLAKHLLEPLAAAARTRVLASS